MLYSNFNMDDIDVQDIDFSHQHHPSKHIKLDSSASAGTRQKSCNACVRGKRRCDKKAPRCTRCAAKNLECVYHKVPPGASVPSESSSAPSSVGVEEVPDLVPQMDLSGFEMESYTTTETSPESLGHIDIQHGQHHNTGHLPIDPAFDVDLSFADIVGATSASDDAMSFPCNMSFDPQILAEQESEQHPHLAQHQFQPQQSPAPRPSPRPVATPASDGSTSNSAQLPVARTKRIRDLTHFSDDPESMCINASEVHNPRSRIGITLAYLKTMHVTFAQKMQVCFMHPQLWRNRLPKPLMMTFSAASAYTNRNQENMGCTMQLLADTAKDVVREGMDATTKEDKLARLQALLLLFVMRMFDGDIASRAAAEKEMPTLLSWTKDLLELLDQSEEGPRATTKSGLAREAPPKSWDSWIYFESARRTRGLVMCLLCVVMLLRDDPLPDREEDWCRQVFTASRPLWEARTPMEFNKVWREQPNHLIRDFDFKEFWQYGSPDDVDEFTRIMFAASVGQDAFNYFMKETPSLSVIC